MKIGRLRHLRQAVRARLRGLHLPQAVRARLSGPVRRSSPAKATGRQRFRQALGAWADAMRYESGAPARGLVPPERADPVPVTYPALVAWAALAKRVSAAARYLTAPFGSYIALTIADTVLRATVIKGNRVRCWAEVDLAPGTVRDGLIVGSDAFAERMAALVELLEPRRKLKDRRIALTLTGRTMVHGRFTVSAPEEDGLEAAVLEAARERLGVRAGELQIDWHATPLPKDEEAPDEGAAPGEADAEEEPRPSHNVYAMGLYRNVVEANLRQITSLGAQVVELQPKALTLAAAVSEPVAIIVDIEPQGASVVVVTDGLPEIVRDIAFDSDLPAGRAAAAIRDELERSVGYHDSLYPDAPLPDETPLFITGEGGAEARIEADLAGLAFDPWELPATLRAPAAFPTARFAAGVGLACMARGRPWWSRRARHVQRPRLRFLPPAYRPRQMPVRLVLAGAAAAALILGLGALFAAVTDRTAAVQEQRYVTTMLEKRVQERAVQLRNAARKQADIESTSAEAQTALQAANAIRNLDRGFAMTLSEVTRHRVDGVALREIDDDGVLVTVRATAAAYATLLAYVQELENSGAFQSVAIRTIGDMHSGATPVGAASFLDDERPGPSLTLELIRSATRADGDPAQDGVGGAWVQAPSTAR